MSVLMAYLVNCTLFGARLSLHGRRVYAAKHCLTCRPTRTREALRNEGQDTWKVCLRPSTLSSSHFYCIHPLSVFVS